MKSVCKGKYNLGNILYHSFYNPPSPSVQPMGLDLLLIIITISDDSVAYIMALSKVIAKRG